MARVLITGGTGFIGSHLVRDCIRRGDDVTIVARPSSDPWRLKDMAGRFRIVRLLPTDSDGLASLVETVQPQHVFHLAAATRLSGAAGWADLDHAMGSTLPSLRLLLDALNRMSRPPLSFVRAGTLAEFGSSAQIHLPGSVERPETAYGLAALMGTHLLRLARPELGYPAVTVRLSLTYGSDQSDAFLVASSIRRALSGLPQSSIRPGAERDLLHVDDVVAALRLAAEQARHLPGMVTVSTGQPLRMAALCRTIQRLAACQHAASFSLPPAAEPTADRLSCHPSPELRALGWQPTIPLVAGLQQVIAWERDAMHRRPIKELHA